MDPEAEPLPLRIRPFDPEPYRPAVHEMLPDGLRQFRRFERHVPRKLLLREPTSHLSFGASEVTFLLCFTFCNVGCKTAVVSYALSLLNSDILYTAVDRKHTCN